MPDGKNKLSEPKLYPGGHAGDIGGWAGCHSCDQSDSQDDLTHDVWDNAKHDGPNARKRLLAVRVLTADDGGLR